MALAGDLNTMPLGELLGWLSGRRASGTLSLGRGMVVRRFHLQNGQIVLASSSEQDRLLGTLLVKRGLVEPSELEEALRSKASHGERLGATLTLSGVVSQAEMTDVVRDKVRELLVDAAAWNDGRFVYEDDQVSQTLSAVPANVDLGAFVADLPRIVADQQESREKDGAIIATVDADVMEVISLA